MAAQRAHRREACVAAAIAVAKFVGQVKGLAATRFNKSRTRQAPPYRQAEYGIFSFDANTPPYFVAYVQQQKEHHTAGTDIPVLECTAEGGVPLVREAARYYAAGYDGRWQDIQTRRDAGAETTSSTPA